MQIGAQMYTVRDFTQTQPAMLETMKKIAAMGYAHVQLSGYGADIPAQAIRDMLDETGLTALTTHVSFDAMQSDFATVLANHRLWGCTHPGVGAMPAAYHADGEAGYLRFAKDASEVAKKFKDEGMTFIYHNHHFEFMRFGERTGYQLLLEESDPALHFELDTHWIQAGGADPAAWIRKLAGRMDIIHFKDMKIVREEGKGVHSAFAEIGQGNLNWDTIFAACKQIGVTHAYVEQDGAWADGDPFHSLETSLRFLRGRGY